MTEKYLEGVVPEAPPAGSAEAADETLLRLLEGLPALYEAAMDRLDYGQALQETWEVIKEANRYLEAAAPWNLAKDEGMRSRLEAVLYNALEAVRVSAMFTAPVMPDTSAEVWSRLGLGDIHAVTDINDEAAWGLLPAGSKVTKGDPLFPRIYEE
jgi:methionyl-tRNA synthetase